MYNYAIVFEDTILSEHIELDDTLEEFKSMIIDDHYNENELSLYKIEKLEVELEKQIQVKIKS